MRRTFNVSDVHVWGALVLILGLCFTTGYYFFDSRDVDYENRLLLERMQAQAIENSAKPNLTVTLPADATDSEVREEYQARFSIVAEELSRLYDLEREVRVRSGLPTQSSTQLPPQAYVRRSGSGGAPDATLNGAEYGDDPRMHPERLLDDIKNPSTDLLLQEARLRSDSIKNLITDMAAQRVRIEHTPSVWPTDEASRYINSKFGRRRDPITQNWRTHGGVDISADYGTPILATAKGKVVFSGYHQYLGNLVKIDHGFGLESWYGHMSKRTAKIGEAVNRGDVIGKVGSTGRSTGAHIHYEVHVSGTRVDPQQFIGN